VGLFTIKQEHIKKSEYVSSLHVSIRKIYLSVQYNFNFFFIIDWDVTHIGSEIRLPLLKCKTHEFSCTVVVKKYEPIGSEREDFTSVD